MIHILNAIVGAADINATPHTAHPKYEDVNDVLRARFVSNSDCLKKASKESDEVWRPFFSVLSRGRLPIDMKFRCYFEWDGLTVEQAIELINHLPQSVGVLDIWCTRFGKKEFMEAVVKCVKRSTGMTTNLSLDLLGRKAGGGEGLADVLTDNHTITYLCLKYTKIIGLENVGKWGDALMENKIITKFQLWDAERDTLVKRT